MGESATPGDVLEQHDEAPRERRGWTGRLGAAAALVAGAVLIGNGGLLSRHSPANSPPESARPTAPASASERPRGLTVIARQGRELKRFGAGKATKLASLPAGFSLQEPLWAVDDAGYNPVLYGVSGGELFRIDARVGGRAVELGAATSIAGPGSAPGELVVQIDGVRPRVVLLDAERSTVIDRSPFPGFVGSGNWTPRGVVTTFGVPGLVLARPGPGRRDEIAIAWSPRGVASGFLPAPLQLFGQPGRLLGVAGDWVLLLEGSCPSPSCRVVVLSFTRDDASLRQVAPPAGWSFTPGNTAGESHEVLVPVVSQADPEGYALARLVPGGDNALLLRDSLGFDPSGGLIAQSDGSAYFLRSYGALRRVLARWSPVETPHVATFPELPALPEGAQLVCVCD